MNQPIKIIVLFLAALSMTGVSFAQQNGSETTESVIVMTRARLDSLLTSIANSKRAQLAQSCEQGCLSEFKWKTKNAVMPAPQRMAENQRAPYQEKNLNSARNDGMVYQELNRINQRIDLLMMKIQNLLAQSNNRYPEQSGTTVIPIPAGDSPTIIYRQGRSARPRYSENAAASDDYVARIQENLNTEIKTLQNRMEALRAKIMNLDTTANDREISRLVERIDMLNTELEEAYRTIESGNQTNIAQKTSGNNILTGVLKEYRQAIYFPNNSADLNSAAMALLSQLAQMIQRSDERVTVLVQGYASKTGSALYNYKLSLRRANAAKDVLIDYGIDAGKIEILGHGVNKSYTAPAARRVEISLLIN